MPANSYLSRVPRLQFSLRALLLLMMVIGAAISIYRWPWVETKLARQWDRDFFDEQNSFGDEYATKKSGRWQSEWYLGRPVHTPTYFGYRPSHNPEYQVSTTYRRGWNGTPQRHGRQQIGLLSLPPLRKYFKHRYYVDDDLRSTVLYDSSDRIVYFEPLLHGLPHGDYRSTSTTEWDVGRYQHGKRVGIWQTSYALTYHQDSERVEVEKSYHAGLLHGNWIWRTPTGRVLQSAKYEMGQLVEWNGLPKAQALEQLLQQCDLGAESRQQLMRGRADAKFVALHPNHSNRLLVWDLTSADTETGILVFAPGMVGTVRWVPLSLETLEFSSAEPPLQTVLELALSTSQTLIVRENRLFLVKISTAELDR